MHTKKDEKKYGEARGSYVMKNCKPASTENHVITTTDIVTVAQHHSTTLCNHAIASRRTPCGTVDILNYASGNEDDHTLSARAHGVRYYGTIGILNL